MAPTKHALLSASSAERWIACPPSARLTEHIPSKDTPYTAEGTEAHALCEDILTTALRVWRGTDDAVMSVPDDEMHRAAIKYVDYIHDLWLAFDHEPSVCIEQHVDFSLWVPEGFGTCDCLLIGDGVLHVVDFKYGAGVPVSPDHNAQMMCYALGALELFRYTDDVTTVRMTIVQPRIQDEPQTWELPAGELLSWAGNVLAPAARQAWEGRGEFNPGETQCRWCKAYPTCRAWADKYGPLADFEPLPDPGLLTDEELGDWLRRVQGVSRYAKDLEEYALNAALEGRSISGWKAVAGRGSRVFTDPDAAFKAVIDSGIDEAMLYERKPISLTAVEKLMGKKAFTDTLSGLVTVKDGAPKLAPESDRRPAINAADGFSEV